MIFADRGEIPAEGSLSPERPHGAGRSLALILVAVLLMAAFLGAVPNLKALLQGEFNTDTQAVTLSSPAIVNGSANVYYPTEYQALANYSLSLVNHDRAAFGVAPVGLSDVPAAQQHADSMLAFGYFSHFDTQGYKPNMRYTHHGGGGSVEENVAVDSWTGPHFANASSVDQAISQLEYSMMYNDSSCCSNGHRLNILNSAHNMVEIGVAFSSTTVYFVEDFENHYFDINFSLNKNTVAITGAPIAAGSNATEALVFFDPTPANMTPAALNAGPHEYTPGLLLGGVLPPCYAFCPRFSSGITVYASQWQFTPSKVSVTFSLAQFVQSHGAGVYTIYLVSGQDMSRSATSTSLFIS